MSDIGFTTGPILSNPDLAAEGIDAIPSTLGQRFEADLAENPTADLYRFAKEELDTVTQSPGQDISPGGMMAFQAAPKISAQDANAKYSIPGELHFESPIAEKAAADMYADKRAELARQDVMRRQPGGIGNDLVGLGTDFLASTLDPLNVASAFVPVVGEERYASWLAEAGSGLERGLVRAGVGAAQGVAGQAPLVAMRYAIAKHMQSDYTAADALTNIAYGGLLGGGLNSAIGGLGDFLHGAPKSGEVPTAAEFSEPKVQARAMETAAPAVQESALRTAIAQLSDGRPIEVMPIFSAEDFKLSLREEELRQHASDLDEFVNNLEVAPEAQAASETLGRLSEVERDLTNPGLTAEARKQLMTRRDELLTNTNPETLRETAAPLEMRRQALAERDNIADQLSRIDQQRAAREAIPALSPLPKLAPGTVMRQEQAMRYAAGEPTPSERMVSQMADNVPQKPTDLAQDTADLEANVKQMQENGHLPEQIAELEQANEEVAKATAMKKGFAQAAMCLGRSAG